MIKFIKLVAIILLTILFLKGELNICQAQDININTSKAKSLFKSISLTMPLKERLEILVKSDYWKKLAIIWQKYNNFEASLEKDEFYGRNKLIQYYHNEAHKIINELSDLEVISLDEAHFLQALFYYRVKSVSLGTVGKGYHYKTPVFPKDQKDVIDIEEQFDIIEKNVKEYRIHAPEYLKAREDLMMNLSTALFQNKLPLEHELNTKIEGMTVKPEPYKELNPDYIEFIVKLSK